MKLKSWIEASRLPAQLFIFPSLLLGQALAFNQLSTFNTGIFVLVFIFGLGMHFFIVYANDYADYETDLKNDTFTPFTGGSRVLVEGKISKKELLSGTYIMVGLVLVMASIKSILVGNFILLGLAFLGLLLLQAYSFGPVKLSYRGFGESLQMLGVGLVLPLFGFIAQGASLESIPWIPILILLPSQLAMAMGTSLPDQPSDALSKKRTSAVLLGVKGASILMVGLFALTIGLSILTLEALNVVPLIILIISGLSLLLMMGLIIVKKPLPGSPSMFLLTGLSILTNTLLVLTLAIQYF